MNYREWMNSDITISYAGADLGTVRPIDFMDIQVDDDTIIGKAYDVLLFACNEIAESTDEEETESMHELIDKVKGFDVNEKVECWYHPMGAWNVNSIEEE